MNAQKQHSDILDNRSVLTNTPSSIEFKEPEIHKFLQGLSIDSPKYQKRLNFFENVVEPAVRGVINHLDRTGNIEKDEHGNRTLKSENYSWTLTHDNKVQITKEDGGRITPATLDQESLDTIKAFASKAQKSGYLLAPAQTQTQLQSPAPVSEAPRQLESPKPAAIKVN